MKRIRKSYKFVDDCNFNDFREMLDDMGYIEGDEYDYLDDDFGIVLLATPIEHLDVAAGYDDITK